MRPSTSPDFLCYRSGNETDDQCIGSESVLSQVIANSGGVLYQLIFGSEIGAGTFLFGNNGVKNLFGVNSDNFNEGLFHQMIEEIIPGNRNRSCDLAEIREKIISGKIESLRAEILITTIAGEKKWIRDTALPLKDDRTGQVMGLTGIFTDITSEKNMLLQLEKARERATESDRLKTAFLNNLSHEIRTPLNAIVGFTTLLAEPGNSTESRLEYMDIITHSSDHLLEIVDDIVDISRIEAKIVRLTLKATNLNDMIQRIYERFSPVAIEKNIILCSRVPEEEETIIITDGYKVFQSLSNIVSNAVKFTRTGKVEFGFSIKKDKVEFYVTDTGIGIAEEHQPNIFNAFYQAESSRTQRYDGTGLGLSIAKAYIELLDGKIWFTSEPGKGSEFFFSIPFKI